MTAFQIQTFIPQDGNFAITLPEYLRGADVELFIAKKTSQMDKPQIDKEEYIARINAYRGTLDPSFDYSDLRDETDREL
jgi:hypothetical protein